MVILFRDSLARVLLSCARPMSSRDGQFDLVDFVDYARGRWQFVAIAVAVALVASAGAGLLLPRRYTATATILIDSPGGVDPRAATAVSPVYLESLRTYEHFASSDSLFLEAIRSLHIREQYPGVASEAMKNQVLKVRKPRDTKVLEISVTLHDPAKAQALAQYIAEKTVALSRSLDRGSQNDLGEDVRNRLATAKARESAADRESAEVALHEPVEGLRSQLESAIDLESRIRRDLAEARADLAGYLGQEQQSAALKARITELQSQQAAAASTIEAQQSLLGKRESHRERVQQEQKSARIQLDAATARLDELSASAGQRGERLKIIDPGIVPERPSFPKRQLIVLSAIFIALVASLLYIAIAFHYQRLRIRPVEQVRRASY
jgi:succinoglycan biosynthesis transport protein ExoP